MNIYSLNQNTLCVTLNIRQNCHNINPSPPPEKIKQWKPTIPPKTILAQKKKTVMKRTPQKQQKDIHVSYLIEIYCLQKFSFFTSTTRDVLKYKFTILNALCKCTIYTWKKLLRMKVNSFYIFLNKRLRCVRILFWIRYMFVSMLI